MKRVPQIKVARLAIPALLAVSLLIVLTVAAAADSQRVIWSGGGQVIFAGPSQDPGMPTTTESRFKLNRDGSVRSVVIHTANEMVAAVLGGGPGGGPITECRDRRGSQACDDLDSLLTGAILSSLHNSTATLSKISHGEIPVTIPTPSGDVVLKVPVLTGSLGGKLQGQLAVRTISISGSGFATGTVEMRIGKGSTGTYACFVETPFGPVPLESLDACIYDAGGQLFPILLDVKDSGSFEVGQGSGSLADILGIKGNVEVRAQSNMLLQQFGGTVEISNAVTELTGENARGDRPRGDGEDDDDGDDGDEDERGRRGRDSNDD